MSFFRTNAPLFFVLKKKKIVKIFGRIWYNKNSRFM